MVVYIYMYIDVDMMVAETQVMAHMGSSQSNPAEQRPREVTLLPPHVASFNGNLPMSYEARVPAKPVAYIHSLLSMNSGLLQDIVAYNSGLL